MTLNKKKLQLILEYLLKQCDDINIISFKKIDRNILIDFINHSKEDFDVFQKIIKSKWNEFILKNKERTIKKSFTFFFYQNFHEIFSLYAKTFFGFELESLELVSNERISEFNLFCEYKCVLSDGDLQFFNMISSKYLLELKGIQIFVYFQFFVYRAFGITIRKMLQEDIYIYLDCTTQTNIKKGTCLNFLVIIKDSKEEVYNNYLSMVLYYFTKRFKGFPDKYSQELLNGREKLYEIALKEYNNSIKDKLVDLFYYFYKKCKIMGNFSPILDFLNFVCSRVEDSVFSKTDIIKKEFLVNFDYTEQKKNSILKIFNFIDQKSTLYSTFQANNLPSPKSQFNLLLLYMKYFFVSGLEALEVGDLLHLPEIFTERINQHNLAEENNTINSKTILNIGNFMNLFAIAVNIENFELLFKKIFNKSINHFNNDFFKTFLKSFNTKLFDLIEQENGTLSENMESDLLTFNLVIDHLCRILYTLIDKMFIRDKPGDASENFIDPRGRYIGKNIALRVLELFMFQDMNFSDDIWPEYIISLNRKKIEKKFKEFTTIPERNFYSNEDLMRFLINNNFKLSNDTDFFENWIINYIIIPLNNFILKIEKSIENHSNKIEIYEKLSEFFLEGIEDKKIVKEVKFVCQQIASFWQSPK